MKIVIEQFDKNPVESFRQCGYRYDGSQEKTREMVFSKSLGPNPYPRFHVYSILDRKTKIFNLNLHLDQKKPVYEGASAHAGEYEGKLIEEEAKKIKTCFQPPKPKLKLVENF